MASKVTLAQRSEQESRARQARAEQIIKEAHSLYLPQHEQRKLEPVPRPLAAALRSRGADAAALELGRETWAIFAVEQRLQECGIIGNHDRWTGKTNDRWVVDRERQSVISYTPEGAEPLTYDQQDQQTLMVGYLVASLAVERSRGFEGITVDIDRVAGEVSLVKVQP